jgi:hypothetical protein
MRQKDVPQDNSQTYEGQNKLIYAVNDEGHYQGVKSSGWEVESFATLMAVEDLKTQALEALEKAQKKQVSPLAYHMARLRFDICSLAQTTGFFQWQIKRHLRPSIFNQLSFRKLEIYCDVMKLSIDELKSLPSNAPCASETKKS